MDTVAYEALNEACSKVNLSTRGATPLRQHATSVYLLPDEQVVARIGKADDNQETRTLALTGWLAKQDFPATEPAVDHPVAAGNAVVTFWVYYPQGNAEPPNCGELGAMLKQLHALPEPPVSLPTYRPLDGLSQAVDASTGITNTDRTWLSGQIARVVDKYHQLDSSLGEGFVHGDAYPGNALRGRHGQPLLGDWDEAARAPRELDLVNTYQGVRFGRPESELEAFTAAYGYDVRGWDGFPVLREMRDLHTLASYIRLADNGNAAARDELQHRVQTLRDDQPTARWNAR